MDLESVLLPQKRQDKEYSGRLDHVAPKAAEVLGYAPKALTRENSPRPSSYTNIPDPQETDETTFSFSEDDLVPIKTTEAAASRHNFSRYTSQRKASAGARSNVYSQSPGSPSNRKVTVQRACDKRELPPPPQQQASASTQRRLLQPRIGEENIKARSKGFSLGRKIKDHPGNTMSPEDVCRTASDARHGSPGRMSAARVSRRSTLDRSPRSISQDGASSSISLALGSNRTLSRRFKKPRESPARAADMTPSAPKNPIQRSTVLSQPLPNSGVTSSTHLEAESQGDPSSLRSSDSLEKTQAPRRRLAEHRDDLWGALRKLDAEFSKFHQKSLSLKVNIVRASLLPFLRNSANNAYVSNLRLEDLERRTIILKKWWTGLLDLLQGKEYNYISGSDRSLFLEALCKLMERREWRYPPSVLCPLRERIKQDDRPQDSIDAIHPSGSDSDDFYLESVHHSIRNSFVQKLHEQMAFVVDKMSQRQSPASVTAFCGETCAYAFFFCPGLANVLVRQWKLTNTNIRKILRAASMSSELTVKAPSHTLNAYFPSFLHSLSFTSLKDSNRALDISVPPIGLRDFHFSGHWLDRWSGRESELFFVFVRHYHQLLTDFLPHSLSSKHRMSAPGIVYVRTQMFVQLVSTIQRLPENSHQFQEVKPNATFDGILAADTPTLAPSVSSALNMRVFAKDRLISTLRDISSETIATNPYLPHFMAESLNQVLKATASSTSLYDQTGCFSLCDFFEEAAPTLLRLVDPTTNSPESIDWVFWIDVFKKMVSSHSVQTETRLYALIFTLWAPLSEAVEARQLLCQDFLLERSHFLRTFCHWSPPVRAYFMRLLCWRLGRYDGDACDLEILLLKTLVLRLQEVWSYHKKFDELAQISGRLRPSTVPSNLLRDRRMLIIRTDYQLGAPQFPLDVTESIFEDDVQGNSAALDHSPQTSSTSILDRFTAGIGSGIDISRKSSSLLKSMFGNRSPETRQRSHSPRTRGNSLKSSPESSRGSSPDTRETRKSMYEQRPKAQATATRNSSLEETTLHSSKIKGTRGDFKFSVEAVSNFQDKGPDYTELQPPQLPLTAQLLVQSLPSFGEDQNNINTNEVPGLMERYAGRALAEWTLIVNECQNFFERRRSEGVSSNRQVETPRLIAEIRPKAI